MADLIKKIKIKKQDGTFTDYIPIGAEAQNVSTQDGDSVQLKLNKKPYYYNTVADMKADTKLKAGDMAATLGFYNINDGGNAVYKIRTIINDDIVDNMFIIQIENSVNLIAELIEEPFLNILQIGAKGDNETINDNFITKAIIKTKNIYIPNGTYIINSSINLTDNYNIKCDGTIKMINTLPAIIIDGIKNTLNINSIVSNGNGIKLADTNKLNYGNILNVNFIESEDISMYLYSSTNGIQYNDITGVEYIGDTGAIKLHVSTNGYWVNENRFHNMCVQCTSNSGIHLVSDKSGSGHITGNRFEFIGFENVYDAITLDNARYNDFISCRSQESISNDHIIFKNECSSNTINKDVTPLPKINTENMTGGTNNIINGVIFDNEINYRTITNQLYVYGNNKITYIPISNQLINTFSMEGTSITLNNNIYTHILAKDNATIKLGYSYCTEIMAGKPILITTGSSSTIVDNNDKVIIDPSDSSLQNYKIVKVTLIGINANTNERYWSKELVS